MNQLMVTRTGTTSLFKPIIGFIALHSIYLQLKKTLPPFQLKEPGTITYTQNIDIPPDHHIKITTRTVTIPAKNYFSLKEIQDEITKSKDLSLFNITRNHDDEVTLDIPKNLKMVFSRNLLQLFNLSMNLEGEFIKGELKTQLPIPPKNPAMIYLHLNQLDRNSNMLDSQPSTLLAVLQCTKNIAYYEPAYPVFLPLNRSPRHDWLEIKLLDDANNQVAPEKMILKLLNKA